MRASKQTTMARKPTLSPSRISTYLACPTKYYWTYINDRGRWYMTAKSHFSFGTSLHKVLERFHDSGDAGVTTAHEAVAALEESWIEAGYSSQDEMNQALTEGKGILEAYVAEVQREPVTSKTVLTEKMLRRDLGPWTLIGRVDRVDEREDGTLEIIDYKSGRQTVTDQQVHDDLAMSSYQALIRHHYPDTAVCATIVALRSGSKGTASLSEEELDAFLEDLRALGDTILNRDWEHVTPIPKALCSSCDFLPLCKKHPEFDADAVPSGD